MKKIILLSTLIFSLLLTSKAQVDWSNDVYQLGKLYPGYVILKDGKKVEGYLKAQFKIKNQTSVVFYANKTDSKAKSKYGKDDLKEYLIADKVYRAVKYSGGISKKATNYCLLSEDGAISKYIWYHSEDRDPKTGVVYRTPKIESKSVYFNSRTDMVLANDQLFFGFAKKFSVFIADNADLSGKVKKKEKGYKMLKILDIISQYNEWATKN